GVAPTPGPDGAVAPAKSQPHRGRFPRKQSIDEARRNTIAATDAIVHVKIAGYGRVRLPANPRHGPPAMPARREDFAQSGCHNFDLRMLLHNAIDHAEEGARVELGLGRDLWTRNAESGLQILFVSYEHVNILDDPPDDFDSAIPAA